MIRRRSREVALQILFQKEFSETLTSEDALDAFCQSFDITQEVRDFSLSLVIGVLEVSDKIDQIIQTSSPNWNVSRMPFVDRNILRLAIYELSFLEPKTPPKVAINEAIEIGKRYGSQDSASFINGVLDNISKSLHQ